MKKPKSKLERAKERILTNQGTRPSEQGYMVVDLVWFRRQLNNLIHLAREEGKEEK